MSTYSVLHELGGLVGVGEGSSCPLPRPFAFVGIRFCCPLHVERCAVKSRRPSSLIGRRTGHAAA
eukprot:6871061-Prorocentrum_lima.AAC.1